MNNDEELRRAVDEIVSKSLDLLSHLEAVKSKTDIRLEDLEAIRSDEQQISKQIESILRNYGNKNL